MAAHTIGQATQPMWILWPLLLVLQVCSAGCETNQHARPDDLDIPLDECAARAQFVYVLDDNGLIRLYRPAAPANEDAFQRLGLLRCEATVTSADPRLAPRPFSMSVNRDGSMWVLYSNGEVFRVVVSRNVPGGAHDGATLICDRSPTIGARDLGGIVFGMGFVSDPPREPARSGVSSDVLYIAGGTRFDEPRSQVSELMELDLSFGRTRLVGYLEGNPELTGNAEGELWGFFPRRDDAPTGPGGVGPGSEATEATVQRIDRSAGTATERHVLPPFLQDVPVAWAFAHWGGDYYIFVRFLGEPSSSLWRFRPPRNAQRTQVELVESNLGYTVVGGGSSTCAPSLPRLM